MGGGKSSVGVDVQVLKARTKLTPTSARTREHLILAGERLFAERGIDNVSLRHINTEAGQRNSSASHYHFGSKDSLIEAISEYRLERLNERRNAWLLQHLPADHPKTVRKLMEALVMPIVAEIEDTDGGENFIRFVSQLLGHPAVSLVAMWRRQMASSVGIVYSGLREVLPEIPEEIFGARFGLAWITAVNGLADRQRLAAIGSPTTICQLPEVYVHNLVDSLTGLIAAPPSEATLAGIRGLRAAGKLPG